MEKLQKDYQAKALDLKRFQDDAQRELEESQRKELGELEKRIMPVIDDGRAGAGLRARLQQVPERAALRRRQAVDLTEAVITKFNSQIAAPRSRRPPKPAAAPPPPSPRRPRPRRRSKPRTRCASAFSVADVAAACGGRVVGDGDRRTLRRALARGRGPGRRSRSSSDEQGAKRARPPPRAGALLARVGVRAPGPDGHRGGGSVRGARPPSSRLFHPRADGRGRASTRPPSSTPGTFVDPSAEIGPYAVVGDRSRVEADAIVEASHGRRGPVPGREPARGSTRTSSSTTTSSLGERVEVHSGAVLGADGFGYATTREGPREDPAGRRRHDRRRRRDRREHVRRPRDSRDDVASAPGTKIDDLVMIGHNCDVGRHDVLCAPGRASPARPSSETASSSAGRSASPATSRSATASKVAGPERHRGGRAGRRERSTGRPRIEYRDATRSRTSSFADCRRRRVSCARSPGRRGSSREEERDMSERGRRSRHGHPARSCGSCRTGIPFLLVDRILSMRAGRAKVVGLKNVTRQRGVLPGPLPGEPGHAGRPDRRGDGAGRRAASSSRRSPIRPEPS